MDFTVHSIQYDFKRVLMAAIEMRVCLLFAVRNYYDNQVLQ